ncbi:hypothetical protein L6452_31271 [Arctium lappa]|uniref:Uncharacterized protein n=1 Tax=Arctium lappa TaxID=4217 RepID=A0ACB8ZJK6_ARCLA|nr:hypothetical protein L6452_31271 [Arctium lappa]
MSDSDEIIEQLFVDVQYGSPGIPFNINIHHLVLYNMVLRGWSDDQVKDAARKLYYSTYKKNFKYEHAWAIVKDEPKWRDVSINDVHTKRTKTDSSGSFTSSSDVQTSFKKEDDETRVRPMGKKRQQGYKKEKQLPQMPK